MKTIKNLILIGILMVLTINFTVALSDLDKEQCENGGGIWTTPTINQGDDPNSNKKILQPFCKCDIGFYWNDISKACEDDSELRCTQTRGTWINDECQCPEETIKWTPGFGCDMAGPVPSGEKIEGGLNSDVLISENKNNFYIYLLPLIILLIIGLSIYFIKRKNNK